MSNLIKFGKHIREMRKVRGLSMAQVADRLADHDCTITAATVGMWERDQRRISADQICLLASVLGCSVESLLFGENSNDHLKRLLMQVSSLSEREQETLLYAAAVWDGNEHALIEWVRMYISIPRRYRTDVAGLAINQFKHLIEDDIIKPVFDVDIKLLESECYKIDR